MVPDSTAQPQDAAANTEALQLQEKESRGQCERALKARQAMSDEDKRKMDSLAEKLKQHCLCQLCKNILLEPWLIKDCGHLYCFRCLHSIVYEHKYRKCPACGVAGSATINEDAFGAFKVVVDANNNRKVAREGGRVLYDDAADSLIRMLWPDRVQEYIHADVEREQRRLEDLAARKHFEVSVQGDRLANPSSTNPGMAAGRRERASGTATAAARRGSVQLKAPPLKLQLPLIHPGVPPSTARDASRMFLVLFMPLQMSLSDEMKEWGRANGLMEESARLPALLKPYMRLPLEQVTLGALKRVVVEALNRSDFWHDRAHTYPAAEAVTANDLAVYVDWTQRTQKTPKEFLVHELPDDADVQPHLAPGDMPYSMHAVKQFLLEQHFSLGVSLDLVYCWRREALHRVPVIQ